MLAVICVSAVLLYGTSSAETTGVSGPILGMGTAHMTAPEADDSTPERTQADLPPPRGVDKSKSGRDRAPIVHAPVVERPPAVDGDLSDECWQRAYHSEGFWDCDNDRKAAQQSEVWLCVDGESLYVAVYCHDTEPSLIRAQEKKRNGNLWPDDFVEVVLDTTYTQGRTYVFQVTPRGTMKEGIPGGSDAKVEWRGDWLGAGRILDDGWCCELAIPWSILRYPGGQREMGIALSRHIPRTDDWSAWPDMGAGWDSKEFAHVVGLDLPRIKRPILWMPNVQVELTDESFRTNVGLDAKHTFDNGLTALVTWAPDYRNIEDEVESIDFSYTERYYRDRRPFFVTGSSFSPGGSLFYSRRIEDLDLGLKVFGRLNRTNVGLLHTFTFGDRMDSAVEVGHQINDTWDIQGQYVRRDVEDEPLNNVWRLSLDRYERKGCGGLGMDWDYSRSTTTGAPSGHRLGFGIDRWRGNGHWGYWAGYDEVSPDYDPQNGYAPEVDRRGYNIGFNFRDKPQDSWIKRYGYNFWANRNEHFDGSLFHEGCGMHGHISRMEQRDGLDIGMSWTKRPPHNDNTMDFTYYWGDGQLHRGGHVSYAWGDVASADYERYSAGWQCELREDVYGDIHYERRKSDYWDPEAEDEDVDRLTVRMNYDLDDERGFGLAVRTGTLGTNVFATYRQALRDGVDWFVILGDPNTEDTQARIALKTKLVGK